MKRRWVWFSRQGNPNHNVFSVLACLETIVSTVIIWWCIDVFFNWSGSLLLAACLTPIFFLRSPESQKSTQEYFERAVNRPHRFQLYGVMVCIWLYHFEAPIWLWVVAVPFGGLVIGHLFNAWYVQFSRSLFYSRQGIKQLPENYYTALFVYDLTSLPEMFPGSEGIDAIPHWKHSVFFFPHPRNPLTFLLSLCWTFSLISIVVLRFMAKASALIYLPLVYLSWPSDFQTSLQKQMIWIKSQSAKSIELFKFWFACTTVLLFALSAFQAANMLDLNAILSDENPISTLVVLYYVTDLSKIMPWHYLSLSNSLLSIALYFLMDGCRKEAIAGQSAFPKRVSLIIIGTRLRSVLSIFWIAIVMFFTLKFYYLRCDISGIAAQVLGYFLGETCGAI